MKIFRFVLPALFVSTTALAQMSPQPQQQAPQDQAFAAIASGLGAVESGSSSLKFAIIQYQERMQTALRTQAEQMANLQKQMADKDAYWKSYVEGLTKKP